jgi:hypothetical protein
MDGFIDRKGKQIRDASGAQSGMTVAVLLIFRRTR